MHRNITGLLSVVLLGVLSAGCSDAEPTRGATAPTTSAAPATTAPTLPTALPSTPLPEFTSEILPGDCRPFLDRPEVTALTGTEPAAFLVARLDNEPDAPYSCEAKLYGDRAHGSRLLVAVVPADDLGRFFRPALKQIDGSPLLTAPQQKAVTAVLEATAAGATGTFDCTAFSAMAHGVHRQERGANYLFHASEEDGYDVHTAMACTEDVFVAANFVGAPTIGEGDRSPERMHALLAAYSPGDLTEFVVPEIDDSACSLLSPATIAALADADAEPTPMVVPGSGLPGCFYADRFSIARGDAKDWLRAAPALMRGFLDAGAFEDRPAVERRMRAVLAMLETHGSVGSDNACEISIEIGEAMEGLIDPETWVGAVALDEGPPIIQFVRCRDATVAILGVRRALADIDRALANQALEALDEALS